MTADSFCPNCDDEYEDYNKDAAKKKSISLSHSNNPANVIPKFNYLELSKARIPLKTLVYVIGLAPEIAKEEVTKFLGRVL